MIDQIAPRDGCVTGGLCGCIFCPCPDAWLGWQLEIRLFLIGAPWLVGTGACRCEKELCVRCAGVGRFCRESELLFCFCLLRVSAGDSAGGRASEDKVSLMANTTLDSH